MGPGETISLIAVAVAVMVMVGILAGGFKQYLAYKARQLDIMANKTAEQAAQYAAKAERLEQRVRVLERIATDRGADLATQIEDLRDNADKGESIQ